MEIAPGVHKVDGTQWVNCYLVTNDLAFFVVDTGMPGNGKNIVDYIVKQGKKPSDLACIVLTHSDIDHAGSAAELKSLTGANVAIHEADAPVLAGEKEGKRMKGITGLLFRLMRSRMKYQHLKADTLLKDGDVIGGYQVIHCPGHTEGSIVLYHPKDVIFVGDVLRCDDKGNPVLPRRRMTLDIAQATDSVKKISQLEFNVMLPGHGEPVVNEASRMVKALLTTQGEKYV